MNINFRRWSVLLLPVASIFTTSSVFAQIVPANDGTGTIVTPQGDRFEIDGGQLSSDGANLFHSFQEFRLQNGEVANFLSHPNIDNIFGRIIGGNASYINGVLQVSGGNSNLFLINPAGIVFGANASLNVPADFTATTATGIGFESGSWLNALGDNSWANLVGTPNAFDFSGGTTGAVVNEGHLAVSPEHNLGFLGGSVTNSGTVTAPDGGLIVTAVPESQLIRISQPGNVLSLEIEPPRDAAGNVLPFNGLDLPGMLAGTPGEVRNDGKMAAGNLNINAQTVENSGSLDASNPTENGGTIRVDATDSLVQTATGEMVAGSSNDGGTVSLFSGTSFLSGSLDVSAGSQGGRVEVLGNAPMLLGASVDASGGSGGGTVLIGGEFQGRGTTPRAENTGVDAATEIHADAVGIGDGGRVILWADGTTDFAGTITARGGNAGGDGGFIEVSGKEGGNFAGFADASAVLGEAGTLLIDPKNITIVEGGGGGSTSFTSNPGGDSTLGADWVTQTTHTGTNLILQANNDITVNGAIVTNNSGGNGGNLTLQAGRSIFVNANIITDNSNLTLTANETAANGVVDRYRDPGNAEIRVAPGVTLNAGTGAIDLNLSTGEGLTNRGVGDISLDGTILAESLDVTSTGGIVGSGNLTTNSNLALTADTRGINLSNATLNSGGGNIALTGTHTAGTGLSLSGSSLATTGTGNITLEGTGGVGTSGSRGVYLESSSRLSAVDGDISVTGTAGSGTQGNHQGVYINGDSTVESTGNGNITLSGRGGTGTFINQGTTIQANAIVRSHNGDINITGIGGTGSDIEQQGILILDRSTVESTGTGNITLSGTAGSGTGQLYGVSIRNLETGRIAANTGNISIEGTGTDGSDDVRLGTPIGSSTMAGNITIASGNIGIVSPATLQSQGILTFQPRDAADNYTLNAATLGIARDGFGEIAIGHPQGSGTVTLTGEVTGVADPLTVQSPLGTLNLGGNLATENQNLTLNGAIALTGDLTLSTGTGAGDLTVLGTVDGGRNLTLTAGTGNINLNGNLGGTTPLTSLTLNTTELVALGDNITTTNDQIYNNPVTLTGDSTLTANNATFDRPVDGAGNLTIEAEGAVQFNDTVGGTTEIGNLNATGKAIAFAQPVTATGEVAATATGNLTTGPIEAGEIRLSSTEGNLDTGNLNTASATAAGGNITLRSDIGEILTGDLNSSGATDGGEIFVDAKLAITAGAIDSSGGTGAAGNVTLDPIGDVRVTSIDAEGGTTGGDVTVVTQQNFQATETFIAANGQPASISTIGGTQGGTISIEHSNGNAVPFAVGDASTNGTAGTLTTGTDSISSGEFPYNETQGGISLISGVEPPPPPAIPDGETPIPEPTDPELPTPEPTPPETPTPDPIDPGTSTPEPTTSGNAGILIPEPLPEVVEPGDIELPTEENLGNLAPIPEVPLVETPDTNPIDPISPTPDDSMTDPVLEGERLEDRVLDNPGLEDENSPTELSFNELNEFSSFRNQVALLNRTESVANSVTDAAKLATASANDSALSLDDSDSSNDDSASVDAIFDSNNDMVATIWQTEQYRNQEYEGYLGIEAELPNQNVAVAATQERLRDVETQTGDRSALIYVVSRNAQLELILVPPMGPPIRRSVPEASREALFPVISEFRRQLTSPRMRDRDTYLVSAQQLYQWLIAPLEPDLQSAKIDTLLLSLDAGLRSLPIAALHDGSQFLVEKYSLSLIPSFSLLNADYRPIENVEVLAMGASEFSDQTPLPSVPVELATISQTLGDGTAFLNEDFTRDNLFAQHKTLAYPILHLATHADFQAGTPRNSYIQLWNDKLTLDELPSLNLSDPQVELVVLSACRTAVGDREAELGFGGLAVMSGAKSALASLWYVSDEGTFSLMSGFYESLGQATTKAEALRQAQIGLLSGETRFEGGQLHLADGTTVPLPPALQNLGDRDLSHPYYWSSFILIGSPW